MIAKISAGLERAFAERGFVEPSVGELSDAAGVSLRTLYKYMTSRKEMTYAALEYRHKRFISCIFMDLPENNQDALTLILNRTGVWMENESSLGCLFHAAVSASPTDERLRILVRQHHSEVADRTSLAIGLPDSHVEIMLIIDGLTQNWPIHKDVALLSAKRLARSLFPKGADGHAPVVDVLSEQSRLTQAE
jgi:AcrR family transcriptional regulator